MTYFSISLDNSGGEKYHNRSVLIAIKDVPVITEETNKISRTRHRREWTLHRLLVSQDEEEFRRIKKYLKLFHLRKVSLNQAKLRMLL